MDILLASEKKDISSSALGLSVRTLRECYVDRPFPSQVIRYWVRPPPPQYGHGLPILTLLFRLNPQILKRCCMDL